MNVLLLKETMLMNEVQFCLKVDLFRSDMNVGAHWKLYNQQKISA